MKQDVATIKTITHKIGLPLDNEIKKMNLNTLYTLLRYMLNESPLINAKIIEFSFAGCSIAY